MKLKKIIILLGAAAGLLILLSWWGRGFLFSPAGPKVEVGAADKGRPPEPGPEGEPQVEGEPRFPKPRLVLLYVPCTVNKAYIAPFSPQVSYTPNISKFAAAGSVFHKHQVECGLSGISYASILSGNYADRHGIFEHPNRIEDDVHLITEAFAQAGYDVLFWGGHPQADDGLNYAQGARKKFKRGLSAEDAEFTKVLERLAKDPEYKAFIFSNFTVTHDPYFPEAPADYPAYKPDEPYAKFWEISSLPKEFKATGLSRSELTSFSRYYHSNSDNDIEQYCDFKSYIKASGSPNLGLKKSVAALEYLYKLNIARLDQLFGAIVDRVDAQGLKEQSLVVFSADHGETMHRDHSFFSFTHGFQLSPEVLSVPLIIRGPGVGIKPSKLDFVTRSIDIYPTVAGLSGVAIPSGKEPDGVDLSEALRAGDTPQLRAFSHTALLPSAYLDQIKRCPKLIEFFGSRLPEAKWVAMRSGDELFKWAKFSRQAPEFKPAVFNLKQDPHAWSNLYDGSNELHRVGIQRVKDFKLKVTDAFNRALLKQRKEIPQSEKERRLRALGYIE